MKRALITLAVLVTFAVLGYVGVYTGLLPAGRLDGRELQGALSLELNQELGAPVTVKCPKEEWKQKNRIIDCEARRVDTNARSAIRVTQDDHRGHYTFVIVDGDRLAQDPAPVAAGVPAAPMLPFEPPAPAEPPASQPSADEPNGVCDRVAETLLEEIASKPLGDTGPLVLPSAYQVRGERGYVVGGFLSSADASGDVDGAFGTWFVTFDGTIYAYTDAALGLTNWPQTGDGSDTPRTRRVRECAEANAG